MTQLKRVVLDILKPHQPNVLEFTQSLAEQGGCQVKVTVSEMDDKTETLVVEIVGEAIDFSRIEQAISEFGASLHSIDEVEVVGEAEDSSVAAEV